MRKFTNKVTGKSIFGNVLTDRRMILALHTNDRRDIEIQDATAEEIETENKRLSQIDDEYENVKAHNARIADRERYKDPMTGLMLPICPEE